MIKRWSMVLMVAFLGSFGFGQELLFRADIVPVTVRQLNSAKCVQVGLYMKSTSATNTFWSQVTATLDYTDPNGYIEGTPFVIAADFGTTTLGGIRIPGQILTNGLGQSTPCAPANILNIGTAGVGDAILNLGTGSGSSSSITESLNPATGRIMVNIFNAGGINFVLEPNVEKMFAIVEFPLGVFPPSAAKTYDFYSGIMVTFVPDSQVPEGNLVRHETVTRIAALEDGGVNVFDGPGAGDRTGYFNVVGNAFVMDADGSGQIRLGPDRLGFVGASGDMPMIGDWNGDGRDDIGVQRTTSFSQFFLDLNQDDRFTSGVDLRVFMGAPGDVGLSGDWDGNGTDELGLFRPSQNKFFLDVDNSGSITGADSIIVMGAIGDLPLAGDWDGDGTDEVGLFRPATNVFYLDLNGDGAITAADAKFAMGDSGDLPLIGDWNGDGIDHVGLFRPSNNRYILDINNDRQINGEDLLIGLTPQLGNAPIIGKW